MSNTLFNGMSVLELFESNKLINGMSVVEFIRANPFARIQIGNHNVMTIESSDCDDDIEESVPRTLNDVIDQLSEKVQIGDNNVINVVIRRIKKPELKILDDVVDEPTNDENRQCKICYENRSAVTVIKCGHVLCGRCSKNVVETKSCPFCRQPATELIKFYL